MMKNKQKILIKIVTILLFILIMVGLADLKQEYEIIFPEILALLIGGILAPAQTWNVSKPKMILLMTLSAFVGIGITNYIVVPLYFQLLVGILYSYVVLYLSKATLVPMISACILPIMLGTRSLIYPISVFLMICFIVMLQTLFGIQNQKQGECFTAKHCLKVALLLSILVAIPAWTKNVYFIVPPLFVAFTEVTNVENSMRKRFFEYTLYILIGAGLGMVGRIFGVMICGFYTTYVAFVVVLILLILMQVRQFFFPPVGALALLPFILPESDSLWLYSMEVTIGALILYFIAIKLFPAKIDR